MTQPTELTLCDAATDAVVTVMPARGGLVTGFDVGERRVLFMDPETLRDPKKSVRGGVPVLFPSPGKLVDDAWAYAGRRGSLKQHGFARELAWEVSEVSSGAATLRVSADRETLARYPWDFALVQRISVSGRSLRLEQEVQNRSDTAMPFGFGFHPYFWVPDSAKGEARIVTRATRAFDNVTRQVVAVGDIQLAGREVDLHLMDHGSTSAELRSPLGTVRLSGSPEYSRWVVWTLPGRDFVCLEPWTGPFNALNDCNGLLLLPPGASRSMSLEIIA